MTTWRSLDDLIDLTEAPDNAGLGIWDRSEIEPHTNRVRVWVPRAERHLTDSFNRRKTHCPFGHAYTEANTYIRPDTKARECKTCRHDRRRERRENGC